MSEQVLTITSYQNTQIDYTHSSDFLISCIFSIVDLPTLRYLIISPSGMVRNRLTSNISCPFSYRIIFASFRAFFAIVKTLSSFILILKIPSYSFGYCFHFSLPATVLLPGHHNMSVGRNLNVRLCLSTWQ